VQHASEVAAAPSPTHPGRPLTVGLLLTVMCIALDGLAVTTVMPIAVRDLGGLAIYGWAFSAFMLASILGITASGRLTDRRGPAVAFAFGVTLFGIGLLAGGVAPSMAWLVVARAIQGLGGGGLSAVIYASVARCYPSGSQPRMLALISTSWVVPGLVGPGLGGFVADHASWRLVFVGLTPVVLLCALLTMPALRRLGGSPPGSSDGGGEVPFGFAFLVAASSALVLLALQFRSALGGAALLVVGVAGALPGVRRLMPAGTLRAEPGLPAAIAAMGLVSLAFFGAETLLPLFLTVFRGQSATMAGLALSGATLTWTAGAWVQARVARRGARSVLVGTGATLIAGGIVVVGAVFHGDAPLLLAPAGWAVVGLGMGLAHSTISLTVIEQAPAGAEGAASASMQLAYVLGVALGAGLGGAAVALVERGALSPTTGFAVAFGIMVLVALATAVLARRLPRGSQLAGAAAAGVARPGRRQRPS
jgi:MFS family permease